MVPSVVPVIETNGHLTLVVDRAHLWFSTPHIQELSAQKDAQSIY